MPSCADPPQRLDASALERFRVADGALLAKREILAEHVQALDGTACPAKTQDGVVRSHDGSCADLGEPAKGVPAFDESHGATPLYFLPPRTVLRQPGHPSVEEHGRRLRSAITALQFPASSISGQSSSACSDQVFYMHELPQVGFGSVIEYAIMFMGRGLSLGAQLRLGPASSRAWTSSWFVAIISAPSRATST